MKVRKAIQILTLTDDPNPFFTDAERYSAYLLSIEALKRVYLQREHPNRRFNTLLSGETED